MKLNILKGALIFVAGGATGAFVYKKLMQDKYEETVKEEMEDIKNFYSNEYNERLDELQRDLNINITNTDLRERMVNLVSSVVEEEEDITEAEFEAGELSKWESLLNKEGYKEKEEEPVEEFPSKYYPPKEKREVASWAIPKVISLEDFMDDSYEKETLTYYNEDDTLVDEAEDPVVNVDDIIGDGLIRFGELSEDDNVVYVRNERFQIDYEVIRVFGSYSRSVLGIIPEKKRRQVAHVDDEE